MAAPQARILVHHIVGVLASVIGCINLEVNILLDDIHKGSPVGHELELRVPVRKVFFKAACLGEFVERIGVQVASNSLVAKSRVILHHHVVPLEGIVLCVLVRIRKEGGHIGTVLERNHIASEVVMAAITRIVNVYELLLGVVRVPVGLVVVGASIAVVGQVPGSPNPEDLIRGRRAGHPVLVGRLVGELLPENTYLSQ